MINQRTGGPRWDILDALNDAAIVLDGTGTLRYANRAAHRLFGDSSAQSIEGCSVEKLLPARHRAHQRRRLERAFANSPSLEHPEPLCVQRLAGEEIAVEARWSWLDNADSRLLLGVLRDESERRARERGLSLALSLQKQLGYATVSIVRLNARGIITHVSEAWQRFASQNGADAATRTGVGLDYLAAIQTVTDPVAHAVACGIRELLAGKRQQLDQIYPCHSSTQLRWYRLEARRSAAHNGGIILTHIDVTAEHKAEAHSRLRACVSDAYASRKPMLEVCRELAQIACLDLEWDFMGTWVLDAPSWTLRCVDVWSRPGLEFPKLVQANLAAHLAPGVGLPGRAWRTRRALWATAADAELDGGHARDDHPRTLLPPIALAAGFRSGLSFAIKYDDDVLAVVEMLGRLQQAEDSSLLHLLEVAGEQLGTAELRERAELRAQAAQAEADAAREELEAVLECAPTLIMAIESDGAVRFVNQPIEGRGRDEVVGKPFGQMIAQTSLAQVEQALTRVLEGGPPQTFEVSARGQDGRMRWSTNFMGPIRRGPRITGALLVSQDVTQIKTAQQELFAAQRLAAIGTLAAGVAHEINTPVQFLGDNVEFLREASVELFEVIEKHVALRALLANNDNAQRRAEAWEAAQAAEERADLDYLRHEVPKAFEGCREGLERVGSIVRSMKEFSHPAEQNMTKVELNRAIAATLTVARSEYKYVADVDLQLGDLPPVTCYVNDINQVVLNIVVNAAHAIADRFSGTQQRGLIRVSTWRDSSEVVIAIADNGGGIPVEIRDRIFEPFFTTKRVGRGTGQGLAIAWAAVKEKHAGELSFETQLGEGTTFYIRLPVAGASTGERMSDPDPRATLA